MAQALPAAALLVTADELLRMPDDGVRRELVRGEVREMSPAGGRHGRLGARLLSRLETYVFSRNLGDVYNADTGFVIASNPDTVRMPDVAFVSRERADAVGDVEQFWPGPPDAAFEVVSPSDSFYAVEEKVAEYLKSGCRMVVVVNPRAQTATVYQLQSEPVRLTLDDTIDGGDVVPGWTLPLRDLFG